MLGDTKATLTPGCHAQIESEANYGTGRLFFPIHEFRGLCRAQPLDIARIRGIATHFGSTITSTLWRCVESDERPCFGVIGAHPHRLGQGESEIEHLIQSAAFAERFSKFDEASAMQLLRGYCGHQRGGPLGAAEVALRDNESNEHLFLAETFCNHYRTLTLAQYIGPRPMQVFVPSVVVARA
jgi:hypothetical protein